jgi:sugar phosphate isomerase/epimerase
MLPLSCSDYTFPLLPHRAALRLIKDLELQAVDIGLFAGRSHLRPEHIAGRESAAGEELRSVLEDLGLGVADVFIQPGTQLAEYAVNHPDAVQRKTGREIFQNAVTFAAACGARHLTGLPGVSFEGVPVEESFKRAIEESCWRAEEAARSGLKYAVEPHVESLIETPERAKEFAMESGVTLTLDYGHFVATGCTNESVHPLVQHASHIHVRGAAPGELQSPVAGNTVDFMPALDAALKTEETLLCLEYVWVDWRGCNRADNVSETILLRNLLRERAVSRQNR